MKINRTAKEYVSSQAIVIMVLWLAFFDPEKCAKRQTCVELEFIHLQNLEKKIELKDNGRTRNY